MVTLEKFKKYARLDSTATDAKMFLDAAVQHAHDAGIPAFLFEIDDPKLELYIYSIADHLYENRGFGRTDPTGADDYIEREKRKMRIELKYRVPEYRDFALVGFSGGRGVAMVISRGRFVEPGAGVLMLGSTATIALYPQEGYIPGECRCGDKTVALTLDVENNAYTARSLKITGDLLLVLQEAENG